MLPTIPSWGRDECRHFLIVAEFSVCWFQYASGLFQSDKQAYSLLKEIKLRRQHCWGDRLISPCGRPAISHSSSLAPAGLRCPLSRTSEILAVFVGKWSFLAGYRFGFSIAFEFRPSYCRQQVSRVFVDWWSAGVSPEVNPSSVLHWRESTCELLSWYTTKEHLKVLLVQRMAFLVSSASFMIFSIVHLL